MTEKEREELREKGFGADQIAAIEEGQAAGLDVSIYAKKEYFAIQMRQIQLGLLEGLKVEIYAKPGYDWFQMEEIRLGLLKGLDIKKYASEEIPYDKMRQVREGLEAGIDLSPFLKLPAGILGELRIALAEKINIVPYIKSGYDTEQLKQIRLALEEGVDIAPYLSKALRGPSIAEITEGLRRGIDASVYADVRYAWRQMREIRLGLENRVDVKQYANPLYNWEQMREIRLGLEKGLDVKRYSSLMYTPREMKRLRTALEEETVLDVLNKDSLEEETEHFENFDITISRDEMQAYLRILAPGLEPSMEELHRALKKSGVREGILEEELERISRGIYFHNPAVIAKGREGEEGKDGWYEYFFRTKSQRAPMLLEDGSVDYQNTQWFEMVTNRQKIAFYHEAEEGRDGYTVTGKVLPGRKGREQPLLNGKGFQLLPDKKTYLAAIDGRIELNNGQLDISKLLMLENVTFTSGNIDFEGTVYIRGNVGNGAVVKAGEDIIVDGFVEGACLESGGNVVLRQGVNATGMGYIRAGKSVMGKFFEAANVYAEQDIQANCCMNSELYAEESIAIRGKEGILIGGRASAVKGILAGQTGNRAGIGTVLRLGVSDRIQRKRSELEDKIKEVEKELTILRNAYVDFRQKYPPEVRNTMEIFLKIESAIFTKEQQADELELAKRELLEGCSKNNNARMVIRGNLYEGTRVEINGIKWDAGNLCNVTLKAQEGRIAVFSNR